MKENFEYMFVSEGEKPQFDSEITCFIYLKNIDNHVKIEIMWSFLMNGLVRYLYTTYGENWIKAEPFFTDNMKSAYGCLINNDKTSKLIGIKLQRRNFEYILVDNPLIDIVLYLKSELDNPTKYTITKKELLDDFVSDMYNSHAEDWTYFDTYFHDTGEEAYGSFKNYSYQRKNPFITLFNLHCRMIANNKEIFKSGKKKKTEIFYLLQFENKDFIKIGHTFRKFELRLYNYIFPCSMQEKEKYDGLKIDFLNSYVVLTDIEHETIKNFEKKSFENKMINLCSNYRVSKESREILKVSATKIIIDAIKNQNNWQLLTLFEYTGYSNIEEFKQGNEKITKKAIQFYGKGQKPEINLNKNIEET